MKVYLDHAATTKIYPEVLSSMNECFIEYFGNPNSSHSFGRRAISFVDNARDEIAQLIGAKSKEIFFTSGGTEADNWALKGLYLANKGRKNRLVVSAVEHSAIIESAKSLQKLGCEVIFVKPNSKGEILAKDVAKEIDNNTFLVSVMFVNNETGVINDIKEIGRICHENNVLFHSDCVQAASCLSLNVLQLNVDLMTISAHKLHGPKGVGLLYIKDGIEICPLIEGGSQELALRGGTTNVPAVVGFAKAFKVNRSSLQQRVESLTEKQNYFESRLKNLNFNLKINGEHRSCLISSVSFVGLKATSILTRLDLKGIAVSAGSACTAGSVEPSHVLTAMGMSEEDALSTVRFSFGEENTFEELDYVIEELNKILNELYKKV